MDPTPPPPNPNAPPPRILIWLQDPVEADLLAIQLRQAGLVVVAARSAEHVRNALAWAPADAFIVEIAADRAADTVAFLKAQRSPNTALYAVAPAGGLDRGTELKLLSAGCRQLWSMPLSAVAIAQEIWSAPPGATPLPRDSTELRGVSGDFRYQSLTYIVQICRRHRINARLHARLADGQGDDWGVMLLRQGEVIDAETPGLRGKPAAVEWLGRATHRFVLHPLADGAPDLQRPDVVQEDVARLVMRARHRVDGEQAAPSTPGSGILPIAQRAATSITGAAPRPDVAQSMVTLVTAAAAPPPGDEASPQRAGRPSTSPGGAAVAVAAPNTRRTAPVDESAASPADERGARSPTTTATHPRPVLDGFTRLVGASVEVKTGAGAGRPNAEKSRTPTAERVPRAHDPASEQRSVSIVERVQRGDESDGERKPGEQGSQMTFRVGPRRSTSPRGAARATRGGIFVAAVNRDQAEGTAEGRARRGTRRGRIAMISHEDAATRTSDTDVASNPGATRGHKAVSFFDHPKLESATDSRPTNIQRFHKDDATEPPHEAVRAEPAGFYVNPKSGLIHLSALQRPSDPPTPPPISPGPPRVNRHHSQLQPHRRREPTNAELRAVKQAVLEEKLSGVGTEDGFVPPGIDSRVPWIAGWVAVVATFVALAILVLQRADRPAATDATGAAPEAVVARLKPSYLSNTLQASELKELAGAMIDTKAAPSEIRPVLHAAARLAPDDVDVTTWLAVMALADGDRDAFVEWRTRADLLAPDSPEVQRLRTLSP